MLHRQRDQTGAVIHLDRQFEFEFDIADHKAGNACVYRHYWRPAIQFYRVIFFLLPWVLAWVYSSYFLMFFFLSWGNSIFIIVALFGMLLSWAGYSYLQQKGTKSFFDYNLTSDKKIQMEFSELGFQRVSKHSKTYFDWIAVSAILESELVFVFFVGGVGYHLPNRVFQNEEARISFKEECEALMATAKAAKQ
ncbi:MAG: YcxB family protein [Robiginitomaculum sp.]|nr:YcxB family protein [Robiginitomaculum sp.]